MIHAIQSMNDGSLKEGFRNLEVITQIHHLIDKMLSEGVLPEGSKLGRRNLMGLSKLRRTAIRTELGYLMEYQSDITNWVEDNTQHSGTAVFNCLVAGAVIGASLGYTDTESTALLHLFNTMSSLPSGKARMNLLLDKTALMKQLAADAVTHSR